MNMRPSLRVSLTFSVMLVMPLVIGCGGGSGSGERDTDVVFGQGFDYQAPSPKLEDRLTQCLSRAHIPIRRHVDPSWTFRIVGLLPADEAGFAILRGGGVAELWIAASPSQAARAVQIANKEDDQAIGSRRNLARARGSVIMALAVRPRPQQERQVSPLYRCADQA